MGDSADTARTRLANQRSRNVARSTPPVRLRRSGPGRTYSTTRPSSVPAPSQVRARARAIEAKTKPRLTRQNSSPGTLIGQSARKARGNGGGLGGFIKSGVRRAKGVMDQLAAMPVLTISGANGRPRPGGLYARDVARELGEQTGALPAYRIARGDGGAMDYVAMAGIFPLSPAKYARLAKLVNPETLAAIKDAQTLMDDAQSGQGMRALRRVTQGDLAEPRDVKYAMERAIPKRAKLTGDSVDFLADPRYISPQEALDAETQFGDIFPTRYTGVTPARGRSIFARTGNLHHGELASEKGYDVYDSMNPTMDWEIFAGADTPFAEPRMGIGGGGWLGGNVREFAPDRAMGWSSRQRLELVRQLQRLRRANLRPGELNKDR